MGRENPQNLNIYFSSDGRTLENPLLPNQAYNQVKYDCSDGEELSNSQIDELKAVTDKGTTIQKLVYGSTTDLDHERDSYTIMQSPKYDNRYLDKKHMVMLAEMLISDKIHTMASVSRDGHSQPNHQFIEDAMRIRKSIQSNAGTDKSSDAAKSGIYKAPKIASLQAAKAVVLGHVIRVSIPTEFSSRHPCEVERPNSDKGPKVYDSNPMHVITEVSRAGTFFKIPVNIDYSRKTLAKMTGISLNSMDRVQDAQGHYIKIPEAAIDKFLGLKNAKERVAS